MNDFTPVAALVGGLLIGTAASGLLLAHGRIAGISGILGRCLFPGPGETGERGWRLAFLVGLPLGAAVVHLTTGDAMGFAIPSDLRVIAAGGLLVGVGTQLGNGCTSGHGVCGIGRGSPRSIVATLTFMAAGMASVALVRHLLGGAA